MSFGDGVLACTMAAAVLGCAVLIGYSAAQFHIKGQCDFANKVEIDHSVYACAEMKP